MASRTSRRGVLRGRPPGYTGIRGRTKAHCSSLRSLGYRWVRIPHFTQLDAPYRTDSKFKRSGFWRPRPAELLVQSQNVFGVNKVLARNEIEFGAWPPPMRGY